MFRYSQISSILLAGFFLFLFRDVVTFSGIRVGPAELLPGPAPVLLDRPPPCHEDGAPVAAAQ